MQLVLFLLLLTMSFALLLWATQPSRGERSLLQRIAEIRDPRRSVRLEAGGTAIRLAPGQTAPRATATGSADGGADWTSLAGAGERLEHLLRRHGLAGRFERLLVGADSPLSIGALVLRALGCALAGTLGVLAVSRSILAAAATGVVGLWLPFLQLQRKQKKRIKTATAELPDTADLLARALRAGHSMTQAMELLGEKGPQLLGAEFARIFQQQKLGVALRDVLIELGERLPSRDLQFLITAILVQRETGGDLASILDRTSDVLRERIKLQAQVRIHTAQGRLTGWILSLMPVVLLAAMMLFSPEYARGLFDDPMGRWLLLAGAVLIATGALVIRTIVEVPA
jgi:tight adherence protein B